MTVYLRWRALLAVRRALLDYAIRQASYWRTQKARAAKGTKAYSHAGAMLADREAKVKLRREQVLYAERVVARHKNDGANEPPHDTKPSPNFSSRNGAKPTVIVLHDTEGGYAGSISWLCNPKSQASAHIINSAQGDSTRLVTDEAKAWAVASDNSFTLNIEQEGYAAQKDWPEAQLRSTARWVAYWSLKYDIPLVFSTSAGVCQHSDLGVRGGGHHDCGPAYPFDHVLALAKAYAGVD